MCHRAPCFPTPGDAKRLIDEGYANQLEFTTCLVPETLNMYYLVAPKFQEGKCVFLTDDDKCSLHESGLKPTEGKLAIHTASDDGLRETVCKTWPTKKGLTVLEIFYEKQDKAEIISDPIPLE